MKNLAESLGTFGYFVSRISQIMLTHGKAPPICLTGLFHVNPCSSVAAQALGYSLPALGYSPQAFGCSPQAFGCSLSAWLRILPTHGFSS